MRAGVIGIASALIVAMRFGTMDTAANIALTSAAVLGVGLVVSMIVHLTWSWATTPRRLFVVQENEIANRDAQLAVLQDSADRKLDKECASKELLSLIEQGQQIWSDYHTTAKRLSHGLRPVQAGTDPIEQIDQVAIGWQEKVEKCSRDRYQSLYGELVAIKSDKPEKITVGSGMNSFEAGRIKRTLAVLARFHGRISP